MPTSVELAAAASPRAPSYFGVSAEFGRANLQARCARGTQEAASAPTSSAPRSSVTRLQTFRQRWFSGWFCKFFDFVANRLQAPVFSPGVLRRHREGATGRCEASRTKPLVVNDGLCHEVEKLARAALFAADATFDCCYPCQTFSTVAFGSPAQMVSRETSDRTERRGMGSAVEPQPTRPLPAEL